MSPPCGWCGLKFNFNTVRFTVSFVTTLRVVWIEIGGRRGTKEAGSRHHLAGGVD